MSSRWISLVSSLGLFLTLSLPAQAEPLQAEVLEIPQEPVFWQQPPAQEQPAVVGTRVAEGGNLRTTRPGKAQVSLSNGLLFRLGGDAQLQITPEISLEQGQIIAWLRPGSDTPPQRIETPVATAAIRGTTVFIEMDPKQGRFFSWEGEVEISLPDGSERVVLQSGDEITIPKGATSLPKPQPISRAEAAERLSEGMLMQGFDSPMETLPLIQKALFP